ncbi:hypothetical protein B2J88_13410 [Rhodococcus sp. SRB_17]|nr:hypothetical protein [Rhodococcus sp. SRB_17]
MNLSLKALLATASLFGALGAQGQPLPADAPAGTTVQCKDGSYASPAQKTGACKGHKGIQTWYGAAPAAAAAGKAAAVETQSSAVNKTGVAPATGAPTKAPGAPDRQDMAAAPGGGPGKVWINKDTKVYHCQGDRYYGKTKQGEYMSEADAKAKGMHAARNKACAA